MNTVLIIPTGIGAEIGGHAGDGNVVAKLIGSVSNIMVTHPNVVNASDINEMPENTFYVEGSLLNRFLGGEIELEKPKSNKILLIVNKPVQVKTIDSANAGRLTLGANIEILELDTPLEMVARFHKKKATGDVSGVDELIKQVNQYDFDALAIATHIKVEKDVALNYFKNGGVNPWGGVEAKASRMIAEKLNKPVAHAPLDTEEEKYLQEYKEIVDPRMSAELVSVCYLHCVLKGLHKAPRIGKGLNVKDIDVLISPDNCWGYAHTMCMDRKIPIIVVKENKTIANSPMYKEPCIFVKNYLEAVGVIQAIKEGISLESLKRPVKGTKIL